MTGPRDDLGAGADRLALVVVNFASSSLLAANLVDPLLRPVIGRIVVVDNPSSVEETTRIRDLSATNGWSLVELPRNAGFGAGVNAGVARARELDCTRVLALNPDATIDADSVRVLLAASAAEPRALIGPRVVRSDGTAWFSGAVLDARNGTTRRARETELAGDRTWQTGACFMATIAMWDEVGGFDDDYFMYWEDIDLSWRWRDAGGTLLLLPDATAVHDAGGTQSRRGQVLVVRVLQLPESAAVRPQAIRVEVRATVVDGQHRVCVERRRHVAVGECSRSTPCCSGPRSGERSRAHSGDSRPRRGPGEPSGPTWGAARR